MNDFAELAAWTATNPKSEAPNPKQIQRSNDQISKQKRLFLFMVLSLDLEIVSDFELRNSDLLRL
jgi:hypothetical protein